ncbi:MAG: anti-sigma factor antagonist [Mycobacterium sp.]|nr:anti-sigma factor antagonist [Mycobacterium sp.]
MLNPRLVAELGDPHSTLRAVTQRHDSAVIVSAGGEIDASNEDIWRRLVAEAAAVATGPGPFVVDVTELDFMGCGAFAILADEANRCRDRGIELRLVDCEPRVARIIEACGFSLLLPLYPTTDSALSAAA